MAETSKLKFDVHMDAELTLRVPRVLVVTCWSETASSPLAIRSANSRTAASSISLLSATTSSGRRTLS